MNKFIVFLMIIGFATAQTFPSFSFNRDSAIIGNNLGNLNGHLGLETYIPVTPKFYIKGSYDRMGNIFGHGYTNRFMFMGNYRF
jgi:hypothetical protein